MNKHKVFRTPYFPIGLSIFLTMVGITVLVKWFAIWLLVGVLVALAIFWSAGYVTRIDLGKKLYEEYISVIWIKLDHKQIHFDEIDRIIVTRKKITHAYRSRAVHRDASWMEYTARLLFNNGAVAVMSDTDLEALLREIKDVANFCQVKVESRLTDNWYFIDMDQVGS